MADFTTLDSSVLVTYGLPYDFASIQQFPGKVCMTRTDSKLIDLLQKVETSKKEPSQVCTRNRVDYCVGSNTSIKWSRCYIDCNDAEIFFSKSKHRAQTKTKQYFCTNRTRLGMSCITIASVFHLRRYRYGRRWPAVRGYAKLIVGVTQGMSFQLMG